MINFRFDIHPKAYRGEKEKDGEGAVPQLTGTDNGSGTHGGFADSARETHRCADGGK